MQYNIHPIIVHFPIALLVLYSFIKIVPVRRWMPTMDWKSVERVLLVFGILGAFVASSTGEIAEHLVRPDRPIVEMHSLFAAISTWMYGLILIGELLSILNKNLIPKLSIAPLTKLCIYLERLLCKPLVQGLLALLGLIAITVTGLLGGVMVYGLSADPIAPIVLKILGLSI